MATNNAINLNSTGIAKYDGAGTFTSTTTTLHNVLIGGASNAISNLALTNGQLAIGSTGADPSAATLTPGTGISISNGAGSIQIDAVGGGLTYTVIAIDQTLAVNHGYGANKGGLLGLTLPAASAVGSKISIIGMQGSWKIIQAAGQQINLGSAASTLGATGFISSTNAFDCVELVCLVADTIWFVKSSIGNITIS